jgi:hypothetical protein
MLDGISEFSHSLDPKQTLAPANATASSIRIALDAF